ncbi:MAG: glycosyltransferase family 4 protein [Acidimicrobiales bacterium]
MSRVLVATPEPIARRLAGPGIRAAQIARVLAADHDVTLCSLDGASTSPIDGRPVVESPGLDLDRFDAAVVQGRVTTALPELIESGIPLAIDWFDPFHTEALHRGGSDRIRRMDLVEGARQTIDVQAHRGDFFLCSNDSQRKHWLGWLAAAGRINHLNHEADPTFRALIDVVPFGIEVRRLQRRRPLRATFPSIGPDDPVILWAGGLHDWLDPLTVIRAMPDVLDRHPDARLVFLAGPHPNTSIEQMGMRGRAIELSRDLKLFGEHVLFATSWIDYEDRLDWLADASVGVVADAGHLESTLSHRTRLLDHLGAGLPTVSTESDPAATIVAAAGAGRLVAPGDPTALSGELSSILADPDDLESMATAATSLGRALSWENTLAPLVRWVGNPRRASDRVAGSITGQGGGAAEAPLDRIVGRARMHLSEGGVRQLTDRVVASGKRRFRR